LERYFHEPYRCIPPHRGTFWYRLSRGLITRTLRKTHGVTRLHFDGLDHFRESLRRGAGILLTPNHCRGADPLGVGLMAGEVSQPVYFLASSHLFRQGRFRTWMLRRLGSFSIWREGPDREAIKEAARILATAERPLVLFPEGTWFRRNDEVMPLQEGFTLIARQAIKQGDRPLVVHPIGVKYWALSDPVPAIEKRLTAMERRLGWSPQRLPPLARVEKLASALLAVREVELLGRPQDGPLDARLSGLVSSQVERLERQHLGRNHAGWMLERIRRVRQLLTQKLQSGPSAEIRADLDVLLLCENLNAHSLAYLTTRPTPERLIETLQRIEETLTDAEETPVVPLGVCVRVGPAIDLRSTPLDTGFARTLRDAIQREVDGLNTQGPPPEWGCPTMPAPIGGSPTLVTTRC
jgi:1-acyl-sn-glycerol-3-phosphate acyltransferase